MIICFYLQIIQLGRINQSLDIDVLSSCRMAAWGSRGEPLGLIVGVKSIKMPILLKASRKDRICLD